MNRFSINIFKILAFVCCTTSVSAQIEKGNYMLGGTAGIENIYGYNVTTINIHPMYGNFLSDRFLLGANANLTYQNFIRRGNTTIKIGSLARYYFNNIFIQTDYSFGIPGRGYFEHDFYLRLGYAYFLNESVALEPYVFLGLIDQISRNGNYNYSYLDDGIYFSIQVYLESALNKAIKMHKSNMKRKP